MESPLHHINVKSCRKVGREYIIWYISTSDEPLHIMFQLDLALDLNSHRCLLQVNHRLLQLLQSILY